MWSPQSPSHLTQWAAFSPRLFVTASLLNPGIPVNPYGTVCSAAFVTLNTFHLSLKWSWHFPSFAVHGTLSPGFVADAYLFAFLAPFFFFFPPENSSSFSKPHQHSCSGSGVALAQVDWSSGGSLTQVGPIIILCIGERAQALGEAVLGWLW